MWRKRHLDGGNQAAAIGSNDISIGRSSNLRMFIGRRRHQYLA